ncbi:Selenide [Chlorella vulgaris]
MQQDLVLLGGGHANIQVLRNFGMLPMPGVRVTLITLEAETPYSGMLPGFLSGFYTFDEMHIDLVRLTQWAGARLILANAQGIDTQGQTVLLCDRPSQHYDVLSINVGICPALSPVLGAEANVIPVKPISRLVSRLEALLIRANAADLPLQVAVVGGGASGVELACAISYRLMRERRAAGIMSTTVTVSLISRGPILQKFDRGIRKAFLLLLQLCAAPSSDGFLLVDEYLKSAGGPSNVFAAGDVASSITCPRPKAGVFAVRAGAPLAHNLRRTLSGGPLRRWAPQATFLSLITAGDRHAVATKGGWLGMQGRWVWQVKDCIDRAFVNRFGADLDYASMERHALPARALHPSLSTNELRLHAAAKGRCGGCGSKIGGASLRRVLQQLSTSANVQHGVLVGFIQADDAAVLELPPLGHVAVQSVDFFRASGFVTDPYLLGQIAANHALSDIHAMGFAVYGSAPRNALLTLRGMRVGQTVILTKPIGTGPALAVLRAHHCQACTDVTGFGLLGHLAEMARASKV